MRHDTIPPVAALLLKARAKLDEGWCQHLLVDERGAVCLLGAINWADKGDPCRWDPPTDIGRAALEALQDVIGGKPQLGRSVIVDFNNTEGRTKTEVLEIFDKAISGTLEFVP